MWLRRSVVPLLLLLLAGLAAGCQDKAARANGAAGAGGAQQDVASIRERYMRINPNNRVGVVVAVRAASKLAAVGDVPLQDFGIGDVLTFVNTDEEPFNTGIVVNATADALHVRYDSDRRSPREGDLAVRLRSAP